MNRLEPPVGISLEPEQLERYVGTYYDAEYDFTFQVVVEDDHLVARVDDEPPVDLILLSETRVVFEGETDPLDFIFGSDGRAEALITVDHYGDVYARVDGGI